MFIPSLIFAQDTLKLSGDNILDVNSQRNLKIHINERSYDYAKLKFHYSISSLLPNITAGYFGRSVNGYVQAIDGEFIVVDNMSRSKSQGLQIDWDFGSIISEVIDAKTKLDLSEYYNKLDNIEENILAKNLFYSLLGSKEKEKSLYQFIGKSKEIIFEIDIQVSSGIKLESDLLSAKSNLQQLEIRLLKQQNESHTFLQNLKLMFSLNAQDEIQLEGNIFYELALHSSLINPKLTIANRIDVVAANRKHETLKKQKKISTISMLLPRLRIGYNTGMLGEFSGDYIGYNSNFLTSLVWSINIVDLLPNGIVNQQKQSIKINAIKKEYLMLEVENKIQTILYSFENAIKQFELATNAESLAKKAYHQYLDRLELGTSTQLELFFLEQSYLDANIELIDSAVNLCVLGYLKKVELLDKHY